MKKEYLVIVLVIVVVFAGLYLSKGKVVQGLYQTPGLLGDLSAIPTNAVIAVPEHQIGYARGGTAVGGTPQETVTGICNYDYCVFNGYTSAQLGCDGAESGIAVITKGMPYSFVPRLYSNGCTIIKETDYSILTAPQPVVVPPQPIAQCPIAHKDCQYGDILDSNGCQISCKPAPTPDYTLLYVILTFAGIGAVSYFALRKAKVI